MANWLFPPLEVPGLLLLVPGLLLLVLGFLLGLDAGAELGKDTGMEAGEEPGEDPGEDPGIVPPLEHDEPVDWYFEQTESVLPFCFTKQQYCCSD